MPNMANLLIDDGQNPPVTQTYTPTGITNGVATFKQVDPDLLAASKVLTISGSESDQRYRRSIRVAFPVKEEVTTDGVSHTMVHGTSYANLTFNFDAHTSLADREDLVATLVGFLTQARVEEVVQGLEGFY